MRLARQQGRRGPRTAFLAQLSAAAAFAGALWTAIAASGVPKDPPEEAEFICPVSAATSLTSSASPFAADRRLYQASFDWSHWSGELAARKLTPEGVPDASDSGVLWKASANIPPHAERRIFTWSGSAGIDFAWDDLTQVGLTTRFVSKQRLDYLRGDSSNEVAGGFRQRPKGVLGAIVNSEIAFAGLPDFGYEALTDVANLALPESIAGLRYAEFLKKKRNKKEVRNLLIVGANDGMLHGIDASTGREEFAYVPRVLIEQTVSATDPRSQLARLADVDFSRRFFVDGSAWVGDAYWGGAWRTVAVGTAGAGGRGVFALAISDPDNPAAPYPSKTYALTKANVLWDLWDVDGTQDPDLGYAFGQPVVGRLKDGHFYAIFGNGRDSHSGCAVLYLVRLDGAGPTQGKIKKIDTGVCGGNGLGRPSLFDTEVAGQKGHRVTDFAYAGDLKGNVWKFDLSSADPTQWGVAIKSAQQQPQPLFSAGADRPITGAIEIGPPPAGVSMPAAMLWFGTGRYFTTADAQAFNTGQAMYGILDRFAPTEAPVEPAQLVKRTVLKTGTDGGQVKFAEQDGTVDYKSKQGWYLELDAGASLRERFVALPAIRRGVLVFATVSPNADCAKDTSAIYAIDPYHGRNLPVRPFVNAPSADFIVSKVGVVRGLIGVDAGKFLYLYAGGSRTDASGSSIQFEALVTPRQSGTSGRVSWREIVR